MTTNESSHNVLTVGDLRNALDGLPDDMIVVQCKHRFDQLDALSHVGLAAVVASSYKRWRWAQGAEPSVDAFVIS